MSKDTPSSPSVPLTLRQVGPTWRRLGLLALVAVAVGTLVIGWDHSRLLASEATALPPTMGLDQLNVYPYVVRPTGERADPINLVFLGTDDVGVVSDRLRGLLDWRDESGGPMLFVQGGQGSVQDGQLASAVLAGERYHVRLKAGQGFVAGQRFVLGAVHTDITVPCGHAGRNFNADRDLVAAYFAHQGMAVYAANWSNTETDRHCDGEENAGDGVVAVIQVLSTP
jgi:hypothetical protein